MPRADFFSFTFFFTVLPEIVFFFSVTSGLWLSFLCLYFFWGCGRVKRLHCNVHLRWYGKGREKGEVGIEGGRKEKEREGEERGR